MLDEQDKALAKRIGRAIAQQRVLRGLRQEEVAERLEIGIEAVSRIECGIDQSSPRITDQALFLSRSLGQLGPEHRQMVMDVVDRLVIGLAAPDAVKAVGTKA